MIRISAVAVVLSLVFCACTSAQYYGGSGYSGSGYGYGGGSGFAGLDHGCNNQWDPRRGYCLKNDCFCNGYFSGQGRCACCGGGCGAGCGQQPAAHVRVTVNHDSAGPQVTNYPICAQCYARYDKNQLYQNIMANQSSQQATPPGAMPPRNANRPQYRYRF